VRFLSEVKVTLTNVGGLSGENVIRLRKGSVNIIKAPNFAGKSSIVKGLAALLSWPISDNITAEIAQRLGIIDKRGRPEPLINIYSDQASVEIRSDQEVRRANITRGSIISEQPGDEKFLITSILSPDAEVLVRINEADVSWLIDKLSFANRYEATKKVIRNALVDAKLNLERIEKRGEEIKALREEIDELKGEKERLSNEIKGLEEEASNLPPLDPALVERRDWLTKELDRIREQRERLNDEIRRDKVDIEKEENKIKETKKELVDILKELKEVEAELDKLIKGEKKKELDEAIRKIDDEIGELQKEALRVEGELRVYEGALNIAVGVKEIRCPLCGKSVIEVSTLKGIKDEVKARLLRIKKDITEKQTDRNLLQGELSQVEDKIKQLGKRLSGLTGRKDNLEGSIKRLESDIQSAQSKLQAIQKQIDALDAKYRKLNEELEDVEKRIGRKDEARRRLYEKISELRQELGKVERSIETKMNELETLNRIEIEEVTVDTDKAKKVYTEWSEVLDHLTEYLEKRIEEERLGAVRRFNEGVKDLLRRLEFKEFEDVWIDEKGLELVVERRGGKRQPISSLSTSEKYALATLLQIAVKETYMPREPFFLLDGTLLAFDKERASSILNYLSEQASKRGWIVCISEVGGERLTVEYLTR
jgi:DNA repair exonuclease SbcCD ATPase subunit